MALHLLLFTSDAQVALILGKLMSEFDIEVEFCSEALTSVEKVTQDNFDAIVVDWDDGPEATFLLKTARELKSTRECLALALVSDAAAGACALQIGAHGVLNKPIVPDQIRENMRTIRDMILSHQADPKPAAPISNSPVPINSPALPATQDPLPVEVDDSEGSKEKPATASNPKLRFLAREPRQLPSLPPMPAGLKPPLREASVGTIFSSTPYLSEPRKEKTTATRKAGIVARIALIAGTLFAAALFYVLAPGSGYFDRLTAFLKSAFARHSEKILIEAKPQPAVPNVTTIDVAPQPPEDQPASIDSGSIDQAAGNIEVTPVAEPTDINTGAPRPYRPVGPVGVGHTEEAQASASPVTPAPPSQPATTNPAVSQLGPPQPAPSQPPSTQVSTAPPAWTQPASIQPAVSQSVTSSTPKTIARAIPPTVDVPQSLKFSSPINPSATTSVPPTPPPAVGGSLNPIVIPEGTARDLLVKKVQPVYPNQALRSGVQGAVVLQAWIAKDGSIRDVKLLRGSFLLARAAVEAVRQWQYKPYAISGQPVDAQTLITVNFKLPSSPTVVAAPSGQPVSSAASDSAKP